ncbi:unnamed protein product [Sphagnum jensenii]|jgi:carotenoid cleavage dioxygenase|uniref:carotenoid 9,10-dioxygenase n=1 Tax=Sphagnum jensenii TaxID=128206 RepID=A0ABP0XIM8_9BRYO
MGKLSDGPASSVPQSAATFFSPNKQQQQQQLNGSGGELSSKTTTSKNMNKFPFGASAAALLCDYLEKILVWMFADSEDPPAGPHAAGKPAGDPHYFLTGSFGPVASETDPASGLTVSGSIPECLNGEFVQVAPNPRFSPVSKYHWFDGDGLLHGLNIKDGKATYVARFVKTSKLQQEEYYGAAKFVKAGDMYGKKGIAFALLHNLRVKLGVLDISNGLGTANTALVYYNNKLLALHEADKPYIIKVLEDGDLETIGREDYGTLADRFTAHPKFDPVTGEMFGFYWKQMELPYLTYQMFSKEGVLLEPVPITIPECVFIHDFAITENYAIFLDLSLMMNKKFLTEGKNVFNFDPSKEARLGLLPRYAKNESQIRWFTIPPCMIFHTVNAWEEGDEVVLIACRMPTYDFTLFAAFDEDKYEDSRPQLYEFKMNLKTGEATQRLLSTLTIEFPRINDNYIGRKQRYAYGAIFDKKMTVIGVAKFDLALEPELNTRDLKIGGNIIGLFVHGDGRRGSEPLFVPRVVDKEIPEDDGYLICFVYDENKGKSETVIIDAKTMASEPVGVVNLPTRVPVGFHSIFVSQEQLNNQRYNSPK